MSHVWMDIEAHLILDADEANLLEAVLHQFAGADELQLFARSLRLDIGNAFNEVADKTAGLRSFVGNAPVDLAAIRDALVENQS